MGENSLEINNMIKKLNKIQKFLKELMKYELLKHLLNKLTSEGRYRNFVQDLETKWRNAYRNTTMQKAISNLNNDTKFSIQTDINGKKYVNVDTNQDIFTGKSLAEQTKIAKKYILDNFRQNGIDVNNEKINVTSKTANEYTHPKNQLPSATKTSKMKASTELNNLLSISEYKYSKPDDGRHPLAKDGWDYYETTFKVGDNLFTGLVNIGKNGNKKTLYDITNIKRIDQNRGTSANAFSTSLVNSSIGNVPQSNINVNTSSTKYSMQLNENNVQELDNSSFSLEQDIEKYLMPEIYDRYKNEDKTKITETLEELKKYKDILNPNESDEDWNKNFHTNQKIKALNEGFDNVYDYLVNHDKNELMKNYKYNPQKIEEKINKYKSKDNYAKTVNEDYKNATAKQQTQFDIIQETNPAPEESNYVWIRKPSDIKTFEEVINDEDSFSWGDYSKEDALRDLKKGTVTIYSSYPIKNGVFVSTSYQQALDYAGGDPSRVHSRKSSIDSVAWINGDEGQYAKITTNPNNEIEIRINPDSKSAGEFLMVHEVSHAIKSNEMIELINDFASRNEKFAESVKEIETKYGKNLTSEEVFADVCGQLFGNEEFIQSLETKNTVESKNIIKQVYELLKHLLNKLTSEGRYRNFVQDLETKRRNAYRNTTMQQATNNLKKKIF